MIEAIVAVTLGLLVTGFLGGVFVVMALATRRDERELRLQSTLAERAARGAWAITPMHIHDPGTRSASPEDYRREHLSPGRRAA